MDFTTNQWIIVGLVLVLGWLLGLLSHSGAGRWKREALAERDARIAAERDRDTRLAAANARITELEQDHRPFVAGTTGAVAAAAAGNRDDLTRINGINTAVEARLNELGLHTFRDVATLTDGDAAALETRLGLAAGTIAREDWRGQAAALR